MLMNFTEDRSAAEPDPWKTRLDAMSAYVSSSAPPQTLKMPAQKSLLVTAKMKEPF
jgi:hypothetical protein